MNMVNVKFFLEDLIEEVESSRGGLAYDFEFPQGKSQDYLAGFYNGNEYFAEYMVSLLKEISESPENYIES